VVDRLEDGDPFFFVPAGVMRELDGLKRDPKRGKRALEAMKRIQELVSMGRCRIVEGNERRKGMLASPVDEEVVRRNCPDAQGKGGKRLPPDHRPGSDGRGGECSNKKNTFKG